MAQSLNNPEQQVHDVSTEEINALANFQIRMKEHNPIMRLSAILRRGDTLEYEILNAINQILKDPSTLKLKEGLDQEDVNDVLLGFPALEDVCDYQFFSHLPLPFRLLRQSLDLHDVNPVSDEKVATVLVSDTDKNDPRLFEQVGFLFFLGASVRGISEALRQFLEVWSSSPTAFATQDRHDMLLKAHKMTTPIFRNTFGAQRKHSALAPNSA